MEHSARHIHIRRSDGTPDDHVLQVELYDDIPLYSLICVGTHRLGKIAGTVQVLEYVARGGTWNTPFWRLTGEGHQVKALIRGMGPRVEGYIETKDLQAAAEWLREGLSRLPKVHRLGA